MLKNTYNGAFYVTQLDRNSFPNSEMIFNRK